MSTATAIEWTEITWNPITGCDRISPGCDHCYALTMAGRLKAMGPAEIPDRRQPAHLRARLRRGHPRGPAGRAAALAQATHGVRQQHVRPFCRGWDQKSYDRCW